MVSLVERKLNGGGSWWCHGCYILWWVVGGCWGEGLRWPEEAENRGVYLGCAGGDGGCSRRWCAVQEGEWMVCGKEDDAFFFFRFSLLLFFLSMRERFQTPRVVLLSSFYFLFLSVGGQEREVTWKVGSLPSCFQFSSYYRWEPAVGKKIGGR